jgi:adenosylmethionine-8-amino-7-oxononanoate aminotransferase
LDALLKNLHADDVICIADEVMTGFGRTGKLFASEYMEEKPDIICLSKGLTGGTMPLGVTACTEKIYQAYVDEDKRKTFYHGHSFTANPLGCTAALASLDLLQKEECRVQIEMISKRNQSFASKLTSNHPARAEQIKNIRTLGTILAFEVTQGKDEYLNNVSSVITEKALTKGVYLRPLGNTVYIMPPYCITEKELEEVYKVIEEILEETKAD